MAIEPLVSIGGFHFPEPSTYRATSATMVDSARNAEGKMIGAVIRNDVAKIEMSWKYLDAYKWAEILTLFADSFTNKVRFLNQTTNAYEERDFYVGDRTADMWRRDPQTGAVMGYTGCAISLIEV